MSTAIQLAIVLGYLVVVLGVGLVAYRVTERTAEDYFLASRTLGTVVMLFTMFATLLSAFTFFGGPDIAYANGPEWLLVMGLMDGIIFAVLWYALGYKQWLLGRHHGFLTLGELLGARFASRSVRALVALVSLGWLFPYVMLQQIGAGAALASLTDGTVPFWLGASLITGFMIAYVLLAGMRGIAWTDTLQGLFMLVVVWVALAWVLAAVGGLEPINAGLRADHPTFLALGSEFYTPQTMLTFAVSIAIGVTMFPQVNQRFFTAASVDVLKRSLALWPVLVVLLFVPAFLLGSWAAGLGLEADVDAGESILPVIIDTYTPAWFAAVVVAGALAAMMSSSDSMLLSGASYFTRDLYRPLVDPELDTRQEDALGRIGVVVFATASLLASIWVHEGGLGAGSIGSVLVSIGDLAFGGFAQLAPAVGLALYWRRTTTAGFVAGIALPQLVYLAANFLPTATVGPLEVVATSYAGWGISLYCLVLGALATVAVSLATRPAPEPATAPFFGDLALE
ncbi:MAG: sodium:solute symporter [Halobacteriales archaeon]